MAVMCRRSEEERECVWDIRGVAAATAGDHTIVYIYQNETLGALSVRPSALFMVSRPQSDYSVGFGRSALQKTPGKARTL